MWLIVGECVSVSEGVCDWEWGSVWMVVGECVTGSRECVDGSGECVTGSGGVIDKSLRVCGWE